jgi:hypothetical protein
MSLIYTLTCKKNNIKNESFIFGRDNYLKKTKNAIATAENNNRK